MRRSEAQPNTSQLPIKFDYTGNYSTSLSLNEKVLGGLADIIGYPQTPLVIKDGKESIARTGIFVHRFTGPYMNGSQEDTKFKNISRIGYEENHGRKQMVLEINSVTLDGYIRDLPDHVLKINGGYKAVFTETLKRIIVNGLFNWAVGEYLEKGAFQLFKNINRYKELKKFFEENGRELLVLRSPKTQ